jgi:hypothetical protein
MSLARIFDSFYDVGRLGDRYFDFFLQIDSRQSVGANNSRSFFVQNSSHLQFCSPQISAPPMMASRASIGNGPCAETDAAPGNGNTLSSS